MSTPAVASGGSPLQLRIQVQTGDPCWYDATASEGEDDRIDLRLTDTEPMLHVVAQKACRRRSVPPSRSISYCAIPRRIHGPAEVTA
jgi:hypothetical protein